MDRAARRGRRARAPTTRARSATTSPPPPRPRWCWPAFRAPYRGRSTPVNAWWGSFDLAVSLFSGRPPSRRRDDFIMRNAMDAQEVAVGWWPGDAPLRAGGVLRLRPPGAGGLRQRCRCSPRRPLGRRRSASTSSTGTTSAPRRSRTRWPSSSPARRSGTPAWSATGTRPWPPPPPERRRPSLSRERSGSCRMAAPRDGPCTRKMRRLPRRAVVRIGVRRPVSPPSWGGKPGTEADAPVGRTTAARPICCRVRDKPPSGGLVAARSTR